MKTNLLRRTLHPEIKVIDDKHGIVEYVASDETLDHYKEVIRAAGWRFTHFAKNAPFVDSHDTSTIANTLGKVLDWRVEGSKLIERVQWAIGMGNQLAEIGFKMSVGGFLKAVSVGFYPTRYASKWDADKTAWLEQLKALGMHEESGINTVYIEQEQMELSACVLGANPNALAKAFHAGAIDDADLASIDTIFQQRIAQAKPDSRADGRGAAQEPHISRARRLHLALEIQKTAQ
jgi:hypothetical protein